MWVLWAVWVLDTAVWPIEAAINKAPWPVVHVFPSPLPFMRRLSSRAVHPSTPTEVDALGSLRMEDADEAILSTLWRRKRLLPPVHSKTPASRRLRRWQLIVTLAAFYECFAITFILAFNVRQHVEALVCVGWAIDACCWLDILLVFRTSFLTAEGVLVVDTKEIAHKYRRTNLPLDIFASVPLELFAAPLGMRSYAFKALRINRALRISRVYCVHGLQLSRLSRSKRLVVIWCCFLMFAHWSACAWWGVGDAGMRAYEHQTQQLLESVATPQVLDRRRRPWVMRAPDRGGTAYVDDPTLAQGERPATAPHLACDASSPCRCLPCTPIALPRRPLPTRLTCLPLVHARSLLVVLLLVAQHARQAAAVNRSGNARGARAHDDPPRHRCALVRHLGRRGHRHRPVPPRWLAEEDRAHVDDAPLLRLAQRAVDAAGEGV